ncbi:patatin-like phospholipase family protein [Nitrospirillum sp. BR 11163]|uniref:patatin-like phospholipase family protein n=1 Tax=Nitrospirillum sp. BR 11163 TaxID=3104323 RepID=UPI002AFE11BC|nr:patatin-like phospholipase family protein [Nitrospirillum sp. BR 11163]MEA1673761.1 patatin-like phospholipase family protein [Nitrospirillum sp. BR 11163]
MTYRILSLDGGGSWALIQALALGRIFGEGTPGREILAEFDMVAANSGGSIVLGGLLENKSPTEIRALFENETIRRSIFSPTRSIPDWAVRELTDIGPKYNAEAKLPALQRLMRTRGQQKLNEVAKGIRSMSETDLHVLIIGFDYDRNRAAFFRSKRAEGGAQLGVGDTIDIELAEAIHASTNAPLNYFDGPAEFPVGGHPGRYWDGGLTGHNNPILAAVTEAIVLDVRPTDIRALSIGTASVALAWPADGARPSPFLCPRLDPGLVTDLKKLATTVLDDPPDAATFIAHVMTGGGADLPNGQVSRIVRMNPLISPVPATDPGPWGPPQGLSPAQFQALVKMDMDAVEQGEVDAIKHLAELWLAGSGAPSPSVRNQPIRMDHDTLACELGHTTFSDALTAWNAFNPPEAAAPGGAA